LLSAVGAQLGTMMWWQGPWAEPQRFYFIPLELCGAVLWLGWCVWAAKTSGWA